MAQISPVRFTDQLNAACEHMLTMDGPCQAEVERLIAAHFPEPEDGWRLALFHLLLAISDRQGEVRHGGS